MRLGTITCLLPMHTQLFSVPPAQPHLWAGGWREVSRSRYNDQSQLPWPCPQKASSPHTSGFFPGVCRERLSAPSGPQLSTCEHGQIKTKNRNCLPSTWNTVCSIRRLVLRLLVIIIFTCLAESRGGNLCAHLLQ